MAINIVQDGWKVLEKLGVKSALILNGKNAGVEIVVNLSNLSFFLGGSLIAQVNITSKALSLLSNNLMGASI